MSHSKRKSSHRDIKQYSDSENSDNEYQKSSKVRSKKHKQSKKYEDDFHSKKRKQDIDEYEEGINHSSETEDLREYKKSRNYSYSRDKSEKRYNLGKYSEEDYSRKRKIEKERFDDSDREERRRDKYISDDENRWRRRDKNYSEEEEDLRENRRKNYENDSSKMKKKKYENRSNFEEEEESEEDEHQQRRKGKQSRLEEKFSDNDLTHQQEKPTRTNRSEITNIESTEKETKEQQDNVEPLSKRQKIVNINMRTGGAYIPPARLRMMQDQIKDKQSEEYQRIAWEALKKSITGMTNKINGSNIAEIIPELFKENIIRGRGVLARAIMQAQAASPTFTRVYAALVAIINTKFPEIGELIIKRLMIQYKRGFRRNDKTICMTAVRFLAHLLNQEVVHEVLILEMVTHLLENPTEDSVEVAIACLKECGKKLTQLSPRGMRAITQRVRDVLHEGNIDVRVRYMIEVFFAIQKDGFKDFEIIPSDLDLVEEDDKYTHLMNLDDAVDAQDMLNIFKLDTDYLENEEKYKSVVKEILGEESDEEGGSGDESDSEGEEVDEEEKNEDGQQIIDMTETNIVCLRRKIYLTVQSSLDFEECAHKLLKLELKPGQILEMCYMILDCCAQQRTYEKFFGLLAQRFCQLNKVYVEAFTEIFQNSYKTIHRLETNKLRNVAKFFAHLLYTDAISWLVLGSIKLNEEDTTSSSRIFIKILFQELCEYMGLPKLNERVKDLTLQEAFEGLFPRDHPHNTRFAINFFTSIGLGGLTDELREHLKKPSLPVKLPEESIQADASSSASTSSSSSSSSTSSSSSDSSSSSSDSDERTVRKHKKSQKKRRK